MTFRAPSSSPTRGRPRPVTATRVKATKRHRPTWQRPRILLAVGFGGVLGAWARYAVAILLPSRAGTFPTSTLVVNLSGAFLLGALLVLFLERWRPSEYVRPLIATGAIGSYTTWSTFMVDSDNLIREGRTGLAAAYVGASLAGGLVAVFAGTALARSFPRMAAVLRNRRASS